MTRRFIQLSITLLVLLAVNIVPAKAICAQTLLDDSQPETTPESPTTETPTTIETFDADTLVTATPEETTTQSIAQQDLSLAEPVSAPPVAPLLRSPLQNARLNHQQISMVWEQAVEIPFAGPNQFQVQISRNAKYNPLLFDYTTAFNETETITPELQDGKYYWRLRAINADGIAGKWSTSRSFSIDTTPPASPRLSSPANNKTVRGIPAYTWKDVSGEKFYQLRFTTPDDPNFDAPVYTSDLLTTRSHRPAEQEYAVWLWQVRAQDAAGNRGDWSAARSVTVKPTIPLKPALLNPVNKSIVEQSNVNFTWNTVKDGDHFQVQVSMSSRFSPLELDETLEPGVTTFSADLYNGLHYWRVRAVNVDGEPGSWSAARSLRVNAPLAVVDCPTCWRPTPGTTWHIHYSGELDTSSDVDMVDVDLVETPQETIDALHAQGRKVVCYFSGGSWENYREDAAQFPAVIKGRVLSGWPDEKWLDIRRLDILAPIMQARLDLAVQKGCDGVDPDNMDGYQNKTGFSLTSDDQLNYNTWIANQAHQRGLAVGLKNDLGQIIQLAPFFDWQLNEQCFYYEECDLLLPFVQADKAVFNIEYELEPADFCAQANSMQFSSMQKHLNLDAWMQPCW